MKAPVNAQSCRFDFTAITQLYCNGSCGTWGGGEGCQQADANAFCKLKLGNAAAVATTFQVSSAAAAPGICCPGSGVESNCVTLGAFVNRGVVLSVSVNDTNLLASHGSGSVVTNVVCAVP